MSKLRTINNSPTHPLSRSRLRTLVESRSKPSRAQLNIITDSKLFQQTRCRTIASDKQQTLKETLYNRNISYFRQSFHPNVSHILPFLASLRTCKQSDVKQLKATTIAPFQAQRTTLNQKIKKSINDMRANPFRLSKINYRWHNTSGLGVRSGCEFECGLRLWKDIANPEASSFNNTITPKRLQTIEPRRYKERELICDRQKRIFTLETD